MDVKSETIAIDVMGADLGPSEVIEGVKLALSNDSADIASLALLGDKVQIEELLIKAGLENHEKLSIVPTTQVIGMDEKPIQSMKQKKDSSMMRGLDLVKAGECAALVSCGNTGSLMAGATVKLRPMQGVDRPALSSIIPRKDHLFVLLDAGANPDTDARQLMHNAVLGSNHAKVALGIENPKIGLLTIGTEEGKGTERIQEAHEYLKSLGSLINYTGLIEGFHIFEKDVDVVVCDGFVGNILVKMCESLFHMLKDLFVEELTENPLRRMGALMAIGAFKDIKYKFNPDRFSCAPLMGINGVVLKAHGSSNCNGIMNAILMAQRMLKQDMNEQIQSDITIANQIIKSAENAFCSA